MVMLYICGACQEDRHEECERGHSAPPGVFGGSICTCRCMGRSKKQWEAEERAAEDARLKRMFDIFCRE